MKRIFLKQKNTMLSRVYFCKKIISVTLIGLIIFPAIILNPKIALAHSGINTSISCGGLSSTDLSTHMSTEVDTRLGSLASSTSLGLWTTRSTIASSGPWLRNTNSWTVNGPNDLDFSGVSPYNDLGGNTRGGTLISPRHLISAHHFPMSIGTKITFVDYGNVAYERTITAVTNITGTDIDVSMLDSDVPNSITYYPLVASSTFVSKLHRFNYNEQKYPPVVSLNQDDYTYVQAYEAYSGYNGYNGGNENAYYHKSYAYALSASSTITNYAKRNEFSGDNRTGDSGDANFLVIDGKLMFAGSHISAGQAPYVGAYINEINSAMTTQGGGVSSY